MLASQAKAQSQAIKCDPGNFSASEFKKKIYVTSILVIGFNCTLSCTV